MSDDIPKIQLDLSPTLSTNNDLTKVVSPTVLQPLTIEETEKVVNMLMNIKRTELELESKRKFDEEELKKKRQVRKYSMFKKWSLFGTGFLAFGFGFSCFFIAHFIPLALYVIGLGFSLMGVSSIVNLNKSKDENK